MEGGAAGPPSSPTGTRRQRPRRSGAPRSEASLDHLTPARTPHPEWPRWEPHQREEWPTIFAAFQQEVHGENEPNQHLNRDIGALTKFLHSQWDLTTGEVAKAIGHAFDPVASPGTTLAWSPRKVVGIGGVPYDVLRRCPERCFGELAEGFWRRTTKTERG